MSVAPQVSIVISSRNARRMLEPCLASIRQDVAAGGLPVEVILVDDGSSDGSAEMVASRFPEAVVIKNPRSAGYARANNIGIVAAQGRAILLLNADTTVRPRAIQALYQALVARPDVASVGPKLLNPDGTIQRSCWKFPLESLIANTLLLGRLGLWDDYRAWDHRADREVDWICSAALMVRREAVETVGLLDERFWLYGVDVDWALRARRAGYRHLSVASAAVVHFGKSSWQTAFTAMSWDHARWHDLFFRKHYGPAGLIFYRTVLLLNSLVRVLVWGGWYLLGHRHLRPKVGYFLRQLRWTLGTARRAAPVGLQPPE